jgi:DNA-binding response OmpR family regulator
MRILLIEDDEHLVWTVKSRMEKQGYAVDYEKSGPEGYERAINGVYDLIILDVMLPGCDGFTVCRNIRRYGLQTPVLMLTARSHENDKVCGLDCGSDDYLVKPFSYPELCARIRALLRRSYDNHSGVICFGEVIINTIDKAVFYKNKLIDLTSKEYRILEYLAYNKNAVVTQDMLQEHIWGDENSIYSNVIEVLISRLRKKLSSNNENPVIKTIKGLGYIIKDE